MFHHTCTILYYCYRLFRHKGSINKKDWMLGLLRYRSPFPAFITPRFGVMVRVELRVRSRLLTFGVQGTRKVGAGQCAMIPKVRSPSSLHRVRMGSQQRWTACQSTCSKLKQSRMGVAQWLGCRSLTGKLSLTYA